MDYTGIEEFVSTSIPAKTTLMIYPSITKSSINICYTISDLQPDASISIYDATCRFVKEFNHLTNHQSTIHWDGKDYSGKKVSSGIYFVSLETEDCGETRKVIMVE